MFSCFFFSFQTVPLLIQMCSRYQVKLPWHSGLVCYSHKVRSKHRRPREQVYVETLPLPETRSLTPRPLTCDCSMLLWSHHPKQRLREDNSSHTHREQTESRTGAGGFAIAERLWFHRKIHQLCEHLVLPQLNEPTRTRAPS